MWRNSSIVVCVAIGTVKITPMNYIVTIRIRARFAVIKNSCEGRKPAETDQL